jgi:MFS family permease
MLLWGGQTVSEIGSSVTFVALPLTAVVVLKATTFQVGLLSAAASLAFAVLALPAGAIIDRHSRRPTMIWCDVARMLVVGSVPVAAALGALGLTQLYVVALAAGVCTVFFDVAYQSYLPALVSREQLVDGNSRLSVTQSLSYLVGPGLAGALVGAFGAATAMSVDAASYAVSVASLVAIADREEPQAPPIGERPGLRAEIAEGLSFVVRQPVLRKIVACTATFNLFFQSVVALEIVFLVRVLRVPPVYTGLVLAAGALGGVVGGLVAGRAAKLVGSARIIWFSVLVLSLPQLLLPFARPGATVFLFPLGYAISMFSGVLYNVAQVSYRQAVCPPRLLGRMNAAVRWIVWGTMPLGGILGGALGTAIGIRPTLWIGIVGSWAAGFWVLFSPLRRMRDLPAEQ